jgi:hypothetical protein
MVWDMILALNQNIPSVLFEMEIKLFQVFGWLLLATPAPCLASKSIYPKDATDVLAEQGMRNLEVYLNENPAQGGCSLETAAKRYEW